MSEQLPVGEQPAQENQRRVFTGTRTVQGAAAPTVPMWSDGQRCNPATTAPWLKDRGAGPVPSPNG